MICPVCSLEGQRINCISGTKSEVVVYHPQKIVRNICYIAKGLENAGKDSPVLSSESEVHEQTLLPGFIGERSAED